jgi:hypothetical protein
MFTFIWLNILKFSGSIKVQFLSSKIFVLLPLRLCSPWWLHHSPVLITSLRTKCLKHNSQYTININKKICMYIYIYAKRKPLL